MRRVALGLLLLAPWLYPPGWGPSPVVPPWLLSLACSGLLLLLLTVSQKKLKDQWPSVAWAWVTAAAISSVIGLCQYFQVEHYFVPWMSLSEEGQAFANLRQRNHFATLTQMGVLAALVLTLHPPNGHALIRPENTFLLCLGVLMALGNVVSASRTGMLEMVFIGLLAWRWGWLKNTSAKNLSLWALFAYLCGALLLPWLAGLGANNDIFARMRDGGPSCSSRLNLWRTVLNLIAQKPWSGWGWGELDFAHFMSLGSGERFCEILGNAHNLPLHLAVELGLPVALLILGGLVAWVLLARPWQETQASRQLAWGVVGLIALHSLLEYPLWYGPFAMTMAVCLMLMYSSRPLKDDSMGFSGVRGNLRRKNHFSHWAIRSFAIFLIVSVAYASWDYHRVSQLYLNPDQRSMNYRDETLKKVSDTWLFRNQLEFAELTLTSVTPDNAKLMHAKALALMHYSPEARVVEKLIESAQMLNQMQEVSYLKARYQAAYPLEYQAWSRTSTIP